MLWEPNKLAWVHPPPVPGRVDAQGPPIIALRGYSGTSHLGRGRGVALASRSVRAPVVTRTPTPPSPDALGFLLQGRRSCTIATRAACGRESAALRVGLPRASGAGEAHEGRAWSLIAEREAGALALWEGNGNAAICAGSTCPVGKTLGARVVSWPPSIAPAQKNSVDACPSNVGDHSRMMDANQSGADIRTRIVRMARLGGGS